MIRKHIARALRAESRSAQLQVHRLFECRTGIIFCCQQCSRPQTCTTHNKLQLLKQL